MFDDAVVVIGHHDLVELLNPPNALDALFLSIEGQAIGRAQPIQQPLGKPLPFHCGRFVFLLLESSQPLFILSDGNEK